VPRGVVSTVIVIMFVRVLLHGLEIGARAVKASKQALADDQRLVHD
jgi:hypothetical protein